MKLAYDAGHGIDTSGKRTPDGEREWTFNDKVARLFAAKVSFYDGVELLRLDDPTEKRDVPLHERTNKANAWGANAGVSIHHNALEGKWGTHTGVETYTQPGSSKAAKDLAAIVQPMIAKAMGLKDRGTKEQNLHMTRESNMPWILTEGGYMDSTIDIKVLRDDARLKAQGESIADGFAKYFGLKLKKDVGGVEKQELNESQEKVRKEAMDLGITDGNDPHREVKQIYVWSALIPQARKIEALEKEIEELKSKIK